MKLVRIRECDGACCAEVPRWPTATGDDCIYHVKLEKQSRCLLQLDPSLIPEDSPIYLDRTGKSVFEETCLNWPENTVPRIGKTGNCCLQWR